MNAAFQGPVKSFEVYRRDKGRTGITRKLSHDPRTGRRWLTEVHEKSSANGDVLRIETITELDELDADERALYELRLDKELAAEAEAAPAV